MPGSSLEQVVGSFGEREADGAGIAIHGKSRRIVGRNRPEPSLRSAGSLLKSEFTKSPRRWCAPILADHPNEKTISLLAISVSHLEKHWDMQLELPLGLKGEEGRPGTKRGMARWMADRAVDMIRDRFGWEAVGYGSR
jgi:hypothetical protein